MATEKREPWEGYVVLRPDNDPCAVCVTQEFAAKQAALLGFRAVHVREVLEDGDGKETADS